MADFTISFEVAALKEALRKADRAAAKAGSEAFSKAAGTMLSDLDEEAKEVQVRATNLSFFLTQWVSYDSFEGDLSSLPWLLPSGPVAKVLETVKIGSGKLVTLRRTGNTVAITCGRMKAELRLLTNTSWPQWEAFDSSGFDLCSGLAERMSQVDWAKMAKPAEPAHWTGVFLDGKKAYASNRYQLAVTDLPVAAVAQPISVPSELVIPFLKDAGEIALGQIGNRLCVQPDDWTQIEVVLYAGKPPNVDKIARTDYEHRVTIDKAPFVDALRALESVGIKDDAPHAQLSFGGGQIAFWVEESDGVQRMETSMGGVDDGGHELVPMRFNLRMLADAVGRAPSSVVRLHYDDKTQRGKPRLHVDTPGGSYGVWLAEVVR
jgi:DNA polymerase III sliding clamp (beta) subunit (PCNA family)